MYLDTSFLAPLAIPEDTSDLVEHYLQRLEPGSLCTSLWTRVELASLLSRRQRMGDFDGEQAERIRAAFDRVLGQSLHLLVPTAEDFLTAADPLRLRPVAAGVGVGKDLVDVRVMGGLHFFRELALAAATSEVSLRQGKRTRQRRY